ncbi:MAG: hypothetical protein KDE26_08060 [Bacteroidetes bacterium]|nr:hypothetical protein [Bacteroidota bacterium]
MDYVFSRRPKLLQQLGLFFSTANIRRDSPIYQKY